MVHSLVPKDSHLCDFKRHFQSAQLRKLKVCTSKSHFILDYFSHLDKLTQQQTESGIKTFPFRRRFK